MRAPCCAQVQQEEAGAGCAATSAAALHMSPPVGPSGADGPGSQGVSGARLTVGGTLAGLVARTPSCVLRPRAFFVSWQGVLTLAFRRGSPLAWRGVRSSNLHFKQGLQVSERESGCDICCHASQKAVFWCHRELRGVNARSDESGAAIRGLPPALVELKAGLEAAHSGLPRENSGSRWPKITLGVLGDARRLLPDQLHRLNALCACACFGA